MNEFTAQNPPPRHPVAPAASRLARAALPIAVLFLLAADDPAPDVKKDMDQLQGEWTAVSLEMRGKSSDVTGWKLYVRGDEWSVTEGKGASVTATIKLDPSHDPKQIDLSYKARGTTRPSRGIYKLDEDTLTLCRTWGSRERPKEFKTTADSGILIVWKRVNN